MKVRCVLLLLILSLAASTPVEGVALYKVKSGGTAILPCPMDDKIHRFQYWLLKNDQVIGPWNNRAGQKFQYEVWSGRLIIKEVTVDESGLYKCFSKTIVGSQLKSETVELLVLTDLEDSFERDSKVNTYRVVIVVLVILIVVIVVIFTFLLRRRRSFASISSVKPERDTSLDLKL